jgi:hypothetical protein
MNEVHPLSFGDATFPGNQPAEGDSKASTLPQGSADLNGKDFVRICQGTSFHSIAA